MFENNVSKFKKNVNHHEQLNFQFCNECKLISINRNLVANLKNKKTNQKFIIICKLEKLKRFEKTLKIEKLKFFKRLNVDLSNN